MHEKTRNTVFILSATFVLAGLLLHFFEVLLADYLFGAGSAGIAVCYLTIPGKELDYRTRRIHRLNSFAGIALVVASIFMFKGGMEWVVFLLISALIQLYTSFAVTKPNP